MVKTAQSTTSKKTVVKKTVSSPKYRLERVLGIAGTPLWESDYYEDIDVLNYKLSKCKTPLEVQKILTVSSKYGSTKHKLIMDMDGKLLFYRTDGFGNPVKVRIKGSTTKTKSNFHIIGTYTKDGTPYNEYDVLGVDPDLVNLAISRCRSIKSVLKTLELSAPYVKHPVLLSDLDGVLTILCNDGWKKIKIKKRQD